MYKIKGVLFTLSVVAIVLMTITGTWASDGSVVKWSQPPDMVFGVNIQSTEEEPIVADDWQCRDPRPVTDVHFWGSYIGWEQGNPGPPVRPLPPPPVVDGFWIRIYMDIPAGVDPDFPYSHPGELLYRAEVKNFQEVFVASILHPDGTYEHKFYYGLDLPEPFTQEEGTIYWISISAIMPGVSDYPWGWETSTRHWNDNATRFWVDNNYWEEITPAMLPPWYQEHYGTVDMAFELTVPYEPPPPPELVKWQQRPDMVQGVNIKSDPNERATVADDWLCLDGSPVSDLHFWGSYPGWLINVPDPPALPPGVEAFRIQVYSDAPAVSPDLFSRPDKLLYEVWTKDFVETYVGSILLPWGTEPTYEHKYRYDLDLPRIFWQKRDRIYWLNISAIPMENDLPWGWESSMDRWNDFAVNGWYENPDNWWWDVIKHPWTEKPIDMSFELTTCEGPIKWIQFPDMANGINIVSLPPDPSTTPPRLVVADDWLCTNGRGITEIHFWGSYLSPDGRIHWEQKNPGPPAGLLPSSPGVEAFRLSFHSDVPAGVDPDMPWSHPGELLDEVRVEFANNMERYWDSIPHTSPDGVIWWEHKFYYIIRLEQPFVQEAGKVYWLDIGAVPKDPGTEPPWYWGWETSKDHWNDNAVIGDGIMWEDLGLPLSDFEDVSLGAKFDLDPTTPEPDNFTTGGTTKVTLKKFQWSGGTWTDTGFARVGNGGLAGGSGNELHVNNVNLDFGLNIPITGLSLLFGEYGGNVNLEINGDFRNMNDFTEIVSPVGGVNVIVAFDPATRKGSLHLGGPIHQFVIGGQELWIDDVKRHKIDMAFLLITEDDTKYCEGDFDRDGDVDGSDLAVFAADFGRTNCYYTGDCEGDVDYDGDVDGSDLAVFAADFGRTDCPCKLPPVGPSVGR